MKVEVVLVLLTDYHTIECILSQTIETMLKVVLNTINQTKQS